MTFSVEKCISDVKIWMEAKKLKLNDEKTETILINPQKYPLCNKNLTIGDENIVFNNAAKNLGIFFDEELSMHCQITNLSKAIYLEMRKEICFLACNNFSS